MSNHARTLIVRFQFEGFHRWKEAPAKYSYLREVHRHIFHVEAEMLVKGDDREIEFIELKRTIALFAEKKFGMLTDDDHSGTLYSCEQMAERILERFELQSCSVFEDNENGARVTRKEDPEIPKEAIVDTKQKYEVPVTSRIMHTPFVGTEAEGPYRGSRCLFIPGGYKFNDQTLLDLLTKHLSAAMVYYGAGNQPLKEERHDYIRLLVERATSYPITLEFVDEGSESIPNYLEAPNVTVVTHGHNEELYSNVLLHFDDPKPYLSRLYAKYITGDKIVWVPYDADIYETNVNDPLFEGDRLI